jgi:hypothetical protein
MKMYQKPEDDEEDDGETTGGNMLRIDPETGAARKVVGVKPQTQMGGKSVEQPGMTTYRLKDPRFAQQLRGMNAVRHLGFNIKGDSITVDQKQKDDLIRMLGDKFDDVFTNKELFKEKMELPPPGMNPEQAREFANAQMAGQQAINQHAAQQSAQSLPPGAIPGRNSPHPKQYKYDEKLDAWIPGPPLTPANEDSYMESLSAALNRKLGVKK